LCPQINVMAGKINIRNKKASFEFFLLEKFVAGIVLTGTEIKSLRGGKASINEAYCSFTSGELYVRNMHIAEYDYGTYNNHEPKRERKLLLTRKELKKLQSKLNEKGLTLVPTYLFINDKGLAKLEIALAKGKKLYDKRETLKQKDNKRELERSGY
jgi:SsrA-binding protein